MVESSAAGAGRQADPADLPTTPVRYLAGRYRLDKVLGRGAMGRVWAAHDEALNRWVAIKEVDFPPGTPASEMDQVAERTMREARAVASVSDPHVVTIFDMLPANRAPAIVMELLDARSLAEVLAHSGPIGDAAAATVGLGVASGLLAAHATGLTHRDVKPGNVLLCRDGRIKLTDFGIARSIHETALTATGLLLGSPAYISPEVAAGHPATAMSDAWGLGGLLYACVQGTPPFDRGDPLKTLISVVQDPVPPHSNSGRLSPLIDALLTKDPSRRMSVAQAQHLLRRLADDPSGRLLAARVWRSTASTPQAVRGNSPPVRSATGLPQSAASSAHSFPNASFGGTGTPPIGVPEDRTGRATTAVPAATARPDAPRGVAGSPGFLTEQHGPSGRSDAGGPRAPGSGIPAQIPVGQRLPAPRPAQPSRPAQQALPPPPWADSSRQLPALASSRAPEPKGKRILLWALAVLLAAGAATGGYFGIRAVAKLATPQSSSQGMQANAGTAPGWWGEPVRRR